MTHTFGEQTPALVLKGLHLDLLPGESLVDASARVFALTGVAFGELLDEDQQIAMLEALDDEEGLFEGLDAGP